MQKFRPKYAQNVYLKKSKNCRSARDEAFDG